MNPELCPFCNSNNINYFIDTDCGDIDDDFNITFYCYDCGEQWLGYKLVDDDNDFNF